MQNEYYYKNQLQKAIEKFIEKETEDGAGEWGWVGDDLSEAMTEAAWSVIKYGISLNKYRDENPMP